MGCTDSAHIIDHGGGPLTRLARGRLAASMWRPGSTNDSGSMAMWTRVPYKARFEVSHFAELTETV